jgi:hypothetical protein
MMRRGGIVLLNNFSQKKKGEKEEGKGEKEEGRRTGGRVRSDLRGRESTGSNSSNLTFF